MSKNIKERAQMFEDGNKKEENAKKEEEKKKEEEEENKKKEKTEKNETIDNNIKNNQQEVEKGKTEEPNNNKEEKDGKHEGDIENIKPPIEGSIVSEGQKDSGKEDNSNKMEDINKTNNETLQKQNENHEDNDSKKLEEKGNINDNKKEDKDKNKPNKKYKEIPIVAHESEKPSIVFEEIDFGIPYYSPGILLSSNATKKKYKEIPIVAHESQKPSIVFEEIDSGKLHSSIPLTKTDNKNASKDINPNENNNTINDNQNKQSNQNNNNNINFDPALFQQFWQSYLDAHGFENNFVNNYFNLDAFMINDEEKKIIEYYRKSDNCGLPNSLNGCIILNTKTHSLGLQNVGATCYMNATLQCLIHIKELSELLLSGFLFKYPRQDENYAKNHRLSLEYINILAQVFFPKLYNPQAICFAPNKFKEIIGELNPLFNGYAANDAKDLLQFILETMHQELKMAVQPFMEYYCDQRVEQAAFQYFSDSYISQNQSPLLKYLYGITKIQTKCLKCNTIKFNFQTYNLLYFPLRESKWYSVEKKKKESKDFDETKFILDLDGCFMYNEKIDHFTGDNQMYCNVCKGCQDSDYESCLFSAPSILAIVLNRGRANQDFQEPFKYSVDIDISKYLKNGQNGKYYLIGMVVHLGESSLAGHFIAYCRMDKESDWYCYNDAFVSKCSNFDEIVEKGTPYILFYHHE